MQVSVWPHHGPFALVSTGRSRVCAREGAEKEAAPMGELSQSNHYIDGIRDMLQYILQHDDIETQPRGKIIKRGHYRSVLDPLTGIHTVAGIIHVPKTSEQPPAASAYFQIGSPLFVDVLKDIFLKVIHIVLFPVTFFRPG